MDKRTADAVVKCLEIDVDFYRELTVFLMKKHTKILQDDLEWLTDSLNDEQAFVMKSRSLEDKRLALFKGLGIEDKKLSELASIMKVYPQVLINVKVSAEGKKKYNNDEYIIAATQKAEMELMGDGRVLVRVSGTEPLVRVMLEGKDVEHIQRLGEEIAQVVKERLS